MATLRAGARTTWVHARDISQSGIKVETDRPPVEGEEVVLTLEGFRPLARGGALAGTDHLRASPSTSSSRSAS